MPIRIITTHLEFEGNTWEQRVVLEGEEPVSGVQRQSFR